MRTRIVILLASLASLMAFAESVNIECSYDENNWNSLSSVYQCSVDNNLRIVTRDAAVIDSTNGTHKSGRNDSDVTAFYLYGKGTVNFFPRNLDRIFSNLTGIFIENVKLKEIHQVDLKPFVDLVRLDLHLNELRFLEAGLFDFNKKLENIDFSNNKLVHIDHFVFDDLEKLNYLKFNRNPCISRDVNDDLVDVKSLVRELETKCMSLDVVLILRELKFLDDPKLVNRPENYPSFERRLEKLEENFRKSPISSHEPIAIRLVNLSEQKYRELLSHSSDPHQSNSNELLDKIQAFENVLTANMTALTGKLSIRRDMQSELIATVTDFASKMTALNEKISKMTVVKNAVVSVGCDRKNSEKQN